MTTQYQSPTRERLRQVIGYTEAAYSRFVQEFTRSGLISIDAFLGRRTEFEQIGRDAIAACISSFEVLDSLYSAGGRHGFSDWYGALWNRMMEGVQSLDELKANSVAFVTFNYDRSLEAFLHYAIKATFATNDFAAEEVWSQFPIHHVYGSLGQFKPSAGLLYEMPKDNDAQENFLRQASGSIKVMPTARGIARDELAMNLIANADVIGFMGFGFDEINCERLDLIEALKRRTLRTGDYATIFATRFGLTNSEVDASSRRLFGEGPISANVYFDKNDQVDCLRNFRDWNISLS